MTIMCPEVYVASIIRLVNESIFADSARAVRIIRVEKVIFCFCYGYSIFYIFIIFQIII